MKHILITGPRGVGKSTLIRRVLKELDRPVFGFETQREPAMEDPELGVPVYIHFPGESRQYTRDNLLGYGNSRRINTVTGAFDRYVSRLLLPIPENGVICFDELGFMESKEDAFRAAVLSRLDGNIPVIAAVKDMDLPFLNKMRQHPKCHCLFITEENRNELFYEALARMKDNFEPKREN